MLSAPHFLPLPLAFFLEMFITKQTDKQTHEHDWKQRKIYFPSFMFMPTLLFNHIPAGTISSDNHIKSSRVTSSTTFPYMTIWQKPVSRKPHTQLIILYSLWPTSNLQLCTGRLGLKFNLESFHVIRPNLVKVRARTNPDLLSMVLFYGFQWLLD